MNQNEAFLYLFEYYFVFVYCSLCRFNDKDEARKKFDQYKSHIPIMLAIDRDLCNLVCKTRKMGLMLIT